MKILGVITGRNDMILGFIAKGSETELSQYRWNNAEEEQVILHEYKNSCKVTGNDDLGVVSLLRLSLGSFSNTQIIVSGSDVKEIGKFKLHNLPLFMIGKDGVMRVDNTIELTGLIIENGKPKGYRVKIGNNPDKLMLYANVLKICKLYKPVNFVIKWQGNKPMFSGKPGYSLSNLTKLNLTANTDLAAVNDASKHMQYTGVKKFDEVYSALMALRMMEGKDFDELLNLDFDGISPSLVILSFAKMGIISKSGVKEMKSLYRWADKNLPEISRENNRPYGDYVTMAEFLGLEVTDKSLAFVAACYICGSRDRDKYLNELFSLEAIIRRFKKSSVNFISTYNQVMANNSAFATETLQRLKSSPVNPIDVRIWLSIPDEN